MSILARLGLTDTAKKVADLGKKVFFYGRNIFSVTYFRVNKRDLTQKGYLGNPFVFQTIDRIAGVTSRLPYVFVDKNGERVEDSEEQDTWDSPSASFWGFELRYKLLADLETTGECFCKGIKGEGFDSYTEFEHIPSDTVEPVYSKSTYDIIKLKIDRGGATPEIIEGEELDDVLFMALPDITSRGKRGLSPLQALWSVVTASTAIFQAEDSIFKNRGVNEILTNNSDQPMTPNQRDKLQEDFQTDTAGTDKFGQILLTNATLKNLKLGMSPSDLKLLESAISKLRVINSGYGLDSSLFNDPENKTYSNRTEAQKAAYHDVFIPLATNYIIRGFNQWWLEGSSELRLSLDRDRIEAIKSVDSDLSTKVTGEVTAGILTAEEGKDIIYPNT